MWKTLSGGAPGENMSEYCRWSIAYTQYRQICMFESCKRVFEPTYSYFYIIPVPYLYTAQHFCKQLMEQFGWRGWWRGIGDGCEKKSSYEGLWGKNSKNSIAVLLLTPTYTTKFRNHLEFLYRKYRWGSNKGDIISWVSRQQLEIQQNVGSCLNNMLKRHLMLRLIKQAMLLLAQYILLIFHFNGN